MGYKRRVTGLGETLVMYRVDTGSGHVRLESDALFCAFTRLNVTPRDYAVTVTLLRQGAVVETVLVTESARAHSPYTCIE